MNYRIASTLIITFCTALIYADAPTEIHAYATRNGIQLSIIHKVKHPDKHFVNAVSVTFNNHSIYNKEFKAPQSNNASQEIKYISDSVLIDNTYVPLTIGTTIHVTASCNKGGILAKDVVIKETP